KRIRAREFEQNRHTPIVAMTASIQKSVRDRCFEAGMDHFLGKPVTMEHLQQVITVLSRTSSRSAMADARTADAKAGETKTIEIHEGEPRTEDKRSRGKSSETKRSSEKPEGGKRDTKRKGTAEPDSDSSPESKQS